MLIDYRIQNFKSFNGPQFLSLLASSSTRENYNAKNVIEVSEHSIGSVVKSAAIFGPNASGKSNLSDSIYSLKLIVLNSLKSIDSDYVKSAIPFAIKSNYYDIPTEYEVTFLVDGIIYRYGLSIVDRIISEEWLYQTISKESMLFHRTGQRVKFSLRSFPEAKMFTKKDGEDYLLLQTKETVPFVSVLSQFDSKVSSVVIEWFRDLNVITGVSDDGVMEFAIDLYQEDEQFKSWALDILSSMQIQGIEVIEEDPVFPDASTFPELEAVARKIEAMMRENSYKKKKIRVIKECDGKGYLLPVELESDGTKRVIYFLGALYDTIVNDKVLVVDEFDSKLHTLLSKYLINVFHENSSGRSQLIVTCHDTNLLSRDIFRRDQIWFVDKNEGHESELYSLLEYKEYYTRKDNNYSKDYLAGKYGAIPLFSSFNELEEACRDE